jgi:LmeA-like phospholipid-binding
VLVVLGGLFEGADLLARHVAEDAIAGRAVAATKATSAGATLSGWPILWDFFAENSVPSVSLTMQDVPIGPLHVEEIGVTLTKVDVDSGALFTSRSLRLTSISRAAVRAVLTDSELSTASGQTVEILPGGKVGVLIDGTLVTATVQLTGDVLVLGADGRQVLRVDLSTDRLIPKCQMTSSFSAGEIVASCSISPVPASLLSAISGQS